MSEFYFATNKSDVLLAYIVKKWHEISHKGLGRIQLQKICYFCKAKGVPLTFEFALYHYGPFSQEIYDSTDSLILDGVIVDACANNSCSEYLPGNLIEDFLNQHKIPDRHQADVDDVIGCLKNLAPSIMELISTVHYAYRAIKDYYEKEPSKEDVVESVYKAKKGKFSRDIMGEAYDALKTSGLLNWGNGTA